jgi:hypothetical protein
MCQNKNFQKEIKKNYETSRSNKIGSRNFRNNFNNFNNLNNNFNNNNNNNNNNKFIGRIHNLNKINNLNEYQKNIFFYSLIFQHRIFTRLVRGIMGTDTVGNIFY